MAENGPLDFHTVLYSKYDEKVGNHQRNTLGQHTGKWTENKEN